MNEDLISIIVPVYNAEKTIKETIQTIKNQTYKNWEAIFVDDKSTDNSKNIIKNYVQENIQLIELPQNVGPAIARNEALKIAKGRYIAYLDADDLWEKDKLEIQHKFMKENDYEFTYTGYKLINKNGKISRTKHIQETLDYEEALKRIRILSITVMFDIEKMGKEILEMLNLDLAEDIATWWKILRNGYVAYGLDKPLAYYRKTPNTRSSNIMKSLKKRWELYRKFEKISIIKSVYYYYYYIINAIARRI